AGRRLMLGKGSLDSYLWAFAFSSGGAVAAGSGLLAAMSALALSGAMGAATAYDHASYFLIVQRPTLTVVSFGLLGWGAYRWSLKLGEVHRRLAVRLAGTSLFLVNMGFWVGSLWGDTFTGPRNDWSLGSGHDVPDEAFVIVWAIALIAVAVWGLRQNRRWVVNLSAVF